MVRKKKTYMEEITPFACGVEALEPSDRDEKADEDKAVERHTGLFEDGDWMRELGSATHTDDIAGVRRIIPSPLGKEALNLRGFGGGGRR
jgi:hypothetical protein